MHTALASTVAVALLLASSGCHFWGLVRPRPAPCVLSPTATKQEIVAHVNRNVTPPGGVPPLTAAEIRPLEGQVPEWKVVNNHHLERQFTFPDFKSAMRFVNQVGNLAEEQGHHPDITLAWGKVGITIWTHKIDGLTESDFILAAKIDRL